MQCHLSQEFIHAHLIELIPENSKGGELKAKAKAWHYILPILGTRPESLNMYLSARKPLLSQDVSLFQDTLDK